MAWMHEEFNVWQTGAVEVDGRGDVPPVPEESFSRSKSVDCGRFETLSWIITHCPVNRFREGFQNQQGSGL